MILVDTSVWVDHLRSGNAALVDLLEQGAVLAHPFVIGELALGGLRKRAAVIALLEDMPHGAVASHGECMGFIARHDLSSRGVGYVDVHLLASVLLTGGARLWTRDKRLHRLAERLGVAADPA